ncbi:hypothetical protein D9M09_14925 [Janthinobacterium agaricidamnosum]|uniref:Uncharacterized protein n=1 Tax=Janthinobacterium agaricidamnosum TaxID=55508 RepID=A0A3G2EA13_9BURK|nr:hypothetical protein [Janthinobacterium agaricidamnosum]AYM76947.1 hypothetical protein D9M09_14925 [Janthinobacterium agaricidamnosum]
MTTRAERQAQATAKLQAACEKFNAAHQVGAAVSVELDSGEIRETVTVSEAQVLSGHTAVIWLDGVSGCYDLERVTALKAAIA